MPLRDTLEWTLVLAGFALVHLIWQTGAAGLAVALTSRLEPRISAQLRYTVAVTVFLSLPVLAVATACHLAGSRTGTAVAGEMAGSGPGVLPWLAAVAPWAGLLWLLGTVPGAARLLYDLAWTTRAARRARPVDPSVAKAARRAGARFAGRCRADVRSSEAVRVPTVVGLLHPTILLPPDLPTALSQDEVEAIIAHELSHVRRGDLWVNAAQHVVSALLFFHPVAWFMARAIDRDREYCCDDLVTQVGVAQRTYARALARAALGAQAAPRRGLGAGRGGVATRVRRLIAPGHRAARASYRLALPLTAATLVGVIGATRALLPVTARVASAAPAWEARVLADNPKSYTVNATDRAGRFTISVEKGRVTGATVAGVAVPRRSIHQRGARVTLLAKGPGGAIALVLHPDGGFAWQGRTPSGGN